MFLAIVMSPSSMQSNADACAIYKYLTMDLIPRERCNGKEDAMIMAEVALVAQDINMIQDLRILNGRPQNKLFDVFWIEIKALIKSHARVDDRRHVESGMHMLLLILNVY